MVIENTKSEKELTEIIIEVALKHVVFDGWSEAMINQISTETKLVEEQILNIFPRGAVDIALGFHRRDDKRFKKMFLDQDTDEANRRIRDRINFAINLRLDVASKNKEAVKRSIGLFSNPRYFSEGLKATWATADLIWNLVGDQSNDLNWYSKRFILSSIYMSALIIWIDDESQDFQETRGFISRRIDDVMVLEKFKGKVRTTPVLGDMYEKFEKNIFYSQKWKENFPGWHFKK
tara:strand:- start:436 stop:1137 length:702 start_codon:yes stop_codon:yes gene_type:complete